MFQVLFLPIKMHFYLYIGGKGQNQESMENGVVSLGGYNGGGNGGIDKHIGKNEEGINDPPESSAGGGGGTDIRLIGGEADDILSLKSRIIVAAGGGGATSTDLSCSINNNPINDMLCSNSNDFITGNYMGGSGGSIYGYRTNSLTFPGNQTSGSFGIGKEGISIGKYDVDGQPFWGGSTGGGGGGYFGGTTISTYNYPAYCESGGAGGSSYVSGCKECKSVKLTPLNDTTTYGSIHYSGLYFTSIDMRSGLEKFLSPSNEEERGHFGSGAISITFLGEISFKNNCQFIIIKNYIVIFFLLWNLKRSTNYV